MSDDDSVLRKMLGGTTLATEMPSVCVQTGLNLAMKRALDQSFGVNLTFEHTIIGPHGVSDIAAQTPNNGAIYLLIRDGHPTGFIHCTMPVLDGIVSMLSTGLLPTSDGDHRNVTGTDIALSLSFMQTCIATLGQDLTNTPLNDFVMDVSIGGSLAQPKDIPLALSDMAYLAVHYDINLGENCQNGQISIVLPDLTPVVPALDQSGGETRWADRLHSAIETAPAALNVVLHRFPMTLAEIESLSVGDLLPIYGATAASVQLETVGAVRVANGRLGQSTGLRAVRIEQAEARHLTDAITTPPETQRLEAAI